MSESQHSYPPNDARLVYTARMPRSAPEVSIITAAFNAEPYIGQTIESVQNQTFTDWEYTIADGGSTDRTVSIVERYLGDPRIKLVVETSKGRGAGRNAAFALSRGEYVANIDADDLWHPEKLRRQVDVLKSRPSVGLVYTGVEIIDEAGRFVKRPKAVDIASRPLEYLLTVKNPIAHSSVLLRRTAFKNGKYQDETILDADELTVYLTALRTYHAVALLEEPLTQYRIHTNSGLSRVGIRHFCEEYRKGLDSFFGTRDLPEEVHRMRRSAYGTMYYLAAAVGISRRNDLATAALFLLKSAFLRPHRLYLCLFQLWRLLASSMR